MKKIDRDSLIWSQMSAATARFVKICDEVAGNNDTQIAKHLEISRQAVSEMRSRKTSVKVIYIVKLIEKHPNVNVDYIFKGGEQKFIEKNDNTNIKTRLLDAINTLKDAIIDFNN